MPTQEIRRIVGTLVHDTATPIATLRALVALMDKQELSIEAQDLCQQTKAQIKRVANCIEQCWQQVDHLAPAHE